MLLKKNKQDQMNKELQSLDLSIPCFFFFFFFFLNINRKGKRSIAYIGDNFDK